MEPQSFHRATGGPGSKRTYARVKETIPPEPDAQRRHTSGLNASLEPLRHTKRLLSTPTAEICYTSTVHRRALNSPLGDLGSVISPVAADGGSGPR
ncbi:hypothetical protein EYF80_043523 [Liparis tanakae]|uniref:Uncharacterized protein n=1 Tax=Liparis tanakae TaxID=230148 RepID=A0A4Z2FZM2_9TELE|nr:hypothetical protein EYF80_043523 [Liparis tanakae]